MADAGADNASVHSQHLLSFIKNPLKLPKGGNVRSGATLTLSVSYEGVVYEHAIQQTPLFVHALSDKLWTVILKHSEDESSDASSAGSSISAPPGKPHKKSNRMTLNLRTTFARQSSSPLHIVSPRRHKNDSSTDAPDAFDGQRSPRDGSSAGSGSSILGTSSTLLTSSGSAASSSSSSVPPSSSPIPLLSSSSSQLQSQLAASSAANLPSLFGTTFAQLVAQQRQFNLANNVRREEDAVPKFLRESLAELLRRGLSTPNLFGVESISRDLVNSFIHQVDVSRRVDWSNTDPRCIAQLLLRYLQGCRFFENPLDEMYFVAAATLSDVEQTNTLLRLLRALSQPHRDFLSSLLSLVIQLETNKYSPLATSVAALAPLLFPSAASPAEAAKVLSMLVNHHAEFLDSEFAVDRRAAALPAIAEHVADAVVPKFAALLTNDPELSLLHAIADLVDLRRTTAFTDDLILALVTASNFRAASLSSSSTDSPSASSSSSSSTSTTSVSLPNATEFLSRLLRREIADTDSFSTLFRCDSLFTFIFSTWIRLVGRDYLSIELVPLYRHLHELFEAPPPATATADESAEQAASPPFAQQRTIELLTDCLERILTRLQTTVAALPQPIRQLMSVLRSEVTAKWPEHEESGIRSTGNLLFLRWICPFFLNPTNVLPHFVFGDRPARPEFVQFMMSLTKVLQSLANRARGIKDQSLAAMNTWLTATWPRLSEYLASASTTAVDGDGPADEAESVNINVLTPMFSRLLLNDMFNTLPSLQELARERGRDQPRLLQLTTELTALYQLPSSITVPSGLPTELPRLLSDLRAPLLISKVVFEDMVAHVSPLGSQCSSFAVFLAGGQMTLWTSLPEGPRESSSIFSSVLDVAASNLRSADLFSTRRQTFWIGGVDGLRILEIKDLLEIFSAECPSSTGFLPSSTRNIDQQPVLCLSQSDEGVIVAFTTQIARFSRRAVLKIAKPVANVFLQCLLPLGAAEGVSTPLLVCATDLGDLCLYNGKSLELLKRVSPQRHASTNALVLIKSSAPSPFLRILATSDDGCLSLWHFEIATNTLAQTLVISLGSDPLQAAVQVGSTVWVSNTVGEIIVVDLSTLSVLTRFATPHWAPITQLITLWNRFTGRWNVLSADSNCICTWMPSTTQPQTPSVDSSTLLDLPPTPSDRYLPFLIPNKHLQRGLRIRSDGAGLKDIAPSPPPAPRKESSGPVPVPAAASPVKFTSSPPSSPPSSPTPSVKHRSRKPRSKSHNKRTNDTVIEDDDDGPDAASSSPFPGIVLRNESPFPGIALKQHPPG